jgi:hypothetical protein
LQRHGICLPFQARVDEPTPCDTLYESGVDYVYVPWTRFEGDYREMMKAMFRVGSTFESTFKECTVFESTLRLFCQFYLPPCGNSTHFEPPAAVCPSACRVPSLVCPDEWARIVTVYEVASNLISNEITYLINCSNTGAPLHPVPHCCHNAGINTSKYTHSK